MLSPPPAPSLGSAITNRAYACHARHHAPQPPIPSCCLLAGASDQREAPWHAVAVSDKGLSRSQPASGRSHSIITYFCPVGLAQTSVLTPKTPHRTQCAIVRGLSCQLWLSCVPCLRLPLSYPSWARRGYGCWRRGCKLMAGGKSWRQLTAMTSACRTDTHTLCRRVERCRTAFPVGCWFARRACHVAGAWLGGNCRVHVVGAVHHSRLSSNIVANIDALNPDATLRVRGAAPVLRATWHYGPRRPCKLGLTRLRLRARRR